VVNNRGVLDWAPLLMYNVFIMKNLKKNHHMKKVRSKFNPNDIFYTDTSWDTKEVDGVTFLYVIKNNNTKETPKLMRKDSLEYIH
jgi:transposase-like protein